VDVGSVEHFEEISDCFGFATAGLLDSLGGQANSFRIDVADDWDINIVSPQQQVEKLPAALAASDQTYPDALAGAEWRANWTSRLPDQRAGPRGANGSRAGTSKHRST